MENEFPRVLSASTINGDRVRNSAGEDLGEVKEVMIDLSSGRVAYVVLSFGGFLGMGDKLFAIPWEALVLDTQEHAFILNISKETLENAPGFDKDNWPKMDGSNGQWLDSVYTYYGYRPYWR